MNGFFAFLKNGFKKIYIIVNNPININAFNRYNMIDDVNGAFLNKYITPYTIKPIKHNPKIEPIMFPMYEIKDGDEMSLSV